KELVDELYSQLERGVVQIDSEPQMLVYLYSFGNMHQAKLNKAFENIPEILFDHPEINIIDYGCGQAIGTMCYVDFIRQKGVSQKVKRVTLIEPSEICLKRAALHVSAFCPDAEIVTVNKTFDDLDAADIVREEEIPTLHILSNVLDLDFDLDRFAELISDNLKGYNQFVCVGPYFGFSDKDKRMENLYLLLNGDENFCQFYDKNELNPNRPWTAQIRCFSVGELEEELSTEVTWDEVNVGVEDEYGVIYSKDGKRLLKCNQELQTYIVKNGTQAICNCAFIYCESLQQIIIPNSVTSIGEFAFGWCKSLQQITIPSSIESIGGNPFVGCSSFSLESQSFRFIVEDGLFIDKKEQILISYIGDNEDITIPNSVSIIGDSAFECSKSLQQITIPNSVTSICGWAFDGCDSLQQIIIPNSVTIIGDSAFLWCESLQQITIPNSVTSIGELAFGWCELLLQIIIPNSVMSIGNGVFDHCESLQQIIIPEGSVEHFKQMLPKELWDKLYYLKKAVKVEPQGGDDLPF
ncbi:MAG: leucine-rich repeat protein, partial [Bacteroidales bacterium]|nr:leucine-rich repeat protein [Bacteroidales bacterium]